MAASEIKSGTGVTIVDSCTTTPISPLSGSYMTNTANTMGANQRGIREAYTGTAGRLYTGAPNLGASPQGGIHNIGSTDFTNKFLLIHSKGYDSRVQDVSQSTGPFVIVNSSSTSAEEAVFFWGDPYKAHPDYKPYLFNLSRSTDAHKHSSIDVADITHIGIGVVGNASNSSYGGIASYDNWCLLDTVVVIKGDEVVNGPGDYSVITDYQDANKVIFDETPTAALHYMFAQVDIGDNSTETWFTESNKTVVFPAAPDFANLEARAHINDNDLGFRVNASTDDNIYFTLCSFLAAGSTRFYFKSEGSTTPDAVTWTTCTIAGAGETVLVDGHTFDGCLFDDCGEIEASQPTLTGCTIQNAAGTGLKLDTNNGLANATNCAFQNNSVGIHVDIPTGDCAIDVSGHTFSGNSTSDILFNGTGILTITAASGQVITTSGTGTTDTVQPTTTLTINPDVNGCDIYMYTQDTTSIVASGTSVNSLDYVYTGSTPVDVAVFKQGYVPVYIDSQALLDGTVTVNMIPDPVYRSTHGLVYTTDYTYNESTFTPVTRQDMRDFYSAIQDALRTDAATNTLGLRNLEFLFQANGPDSFIFLRGLEADSIANLEDKVYGTGIQYKDSSGTLTAEWASFRSSGDNTAGITAEYQQTDGSGTTDARASGDVDQIVQIYGDGTHGNFTKRDHMVWKFQKDGYYEARVDVVNDLNGGGDLEALEYVMTLSLAATTASSGDPALTYTWVDHTGSPLSVGGVDFDYELQDTGSDSGVDILREWFYNRAQDATLQSRDPFNWPDFFEEVSGSTVKSVRGIVEGESGQSGIYVSRGGNDHPDFASFQGNDGSVYTPAVVNNTSLSNITNGSRLRVYNNTTATEIYNGIPGTSYSDQYTEGTDYTDGDSVTLELTYQSGTTAKEPWTTTLTAGSTGWSATASQEDATTYNNNAIDGSLVTIFSADYVASPPEWDIVVSSNFTSGQALAWYYYIITTEQGIRDFFQAITIVDEANYRINNGSVNVLFDNTSGTDVWQTDNVRIYRADGARPIKHPTTNGGVDVHWREKGVAVNTGGSGLTAGESSQLADIASVKSKTDSLTFTVSGKVDSNVHYVHDHEIDGSGVEGDEFGPA